MDLGVSIHKLECTGYRKPFNDNIHIERLYNETLNTLCATHIQGTKTKVFIHSAPSRYLISVPQGEIEAGLLIGWLLPRLSVWTNQPPGLEVTSLGLRTKHSYLVTMEAIMEGHYPEVQQSPILASEAAHLVQQRLGDPAGVDPQFSVVTNHSNYSKSVPNQFVLFE